MRANISVAAVYEYVYVVRKACSFAVITLNRHHATDSLFPHCPYTVFNKRVVEGILAAKIVATKLGFQSTEINTLSDLHKAMRQKTSNNVTPEGMALIMEANLHGEPYSLDEIEACLGYKVTQQVVTTMPFHQQM